MSAVESGCFVRLCLCVLTCALFVAHVRACNDSVDYASALSRGMMEGSLRAKEKEVLRLRTRLDVASKRTHELESNLNLSKGLLLISCELCTFPFRARHVMDTGTLSNQSSTIRSE